MCDFGPLVLYTATQPKPQRGADIAINRLWWVPFYSPALSQHSRKGERKRKKNLKTTSSPPKCHSSKSPSLMEI